MIHPGFAPARVLTTRFKAGELGKKTGKALFGWSKGRPEIGESQAADTVDPTDPVAVQANEATKVIGLGVCSPKDADTAIVNGTGSAIGPMKMAKGQDPTDLTARLERLVAGFNKEIFKPSRMIREGAYK